MIELHDVCKSFDDGATRAVEHLSLSIAEGETLVLLGSSGCGKTTTLKMINRLVEATSGRILVDNRNIFEQDPVELRRSIGYVFQGIGLFPHLTVYENIGLVLRLLGWERPRRRQRAAELLELVELPAPDYGERLPAELSGGQQQRVGVARALAAEPRYLLMDEPFGALDALTREALQQRLLEIQQQLAKTIVFVTHDISEAELLADRIAVMHEGKLEQLGPPAELREHPATEFVAGLFSTTVAQQARGSS